ncbi:hypothetical protein ACP4OV_019311 [Aristida adscensionis]
MDCSDLKSIPLIDISPLVEKIDDPDMSNDKNLLHVVQMLDDACKDVGFFYVKGHGISESLMIEVRDVVRKFFQLPYEEKIKIKMTPQSGYRCLTPITPGRYGDLGKTLEGHNLWPEDPSNAKALIENYIGLLKDLSRKIMRGIALALGGPVDALEGATAGDPFWACRLLGYPIATEVPEEKRTDTGMGSHTDFGLLTLVNQDNDMCALEVQNHSNEWIDARPIPGTFVCNIGDMLEVWSNGIYQPTVHRAINNSPSFRVSIAFFYETNFDTAIEPVAFCKEKTGGTAKYNSIIYGERLARKACCCFGNA